MSDILNKGLDFLLNSKTRDIWQNTITIMLIMLVIMFLLITISRETSPYMSFVVLFLILYVIILIINLMYVINKFLSIDTYKKGGDNSEFAGFIMVCVISLIAFIGLPICSIIGLFSQNPIANGVFILLFIALFVFYLLTFTLKDKICGNKYIDIFNMFCSEFKEIESSNTEVSSKKSKLREFISRGVQKVKDLSNKARLKLRQQKSPITTQ